MRPVRICQLAVGLIGELLDRESGIVNAEVPLADQVTPAANGSAENLNPITPKVEVVLPDFSFPSSSVAVPQLELGTAAVKCRVCGHPMPEKDEFCRHCGMLVATSDNGLQGKWASMWFMQQAQKAVGTAEGQNVPESTAGKNPTAASLESERANLTEEEIQKLRADVADPAVTEEVLADAKRGPRSVLAILKAQFKVRANGR